MADLTSTAKVKRALGIPSGITMHDLFIDDVADAVDHEVLGYCGLSALTSTGFVEEIDISASGQSEVMLRNFPVSAVAYVTNAGSTLSVDSYYFDSRTGTVRLTASGNFFEIGRATVEVSYTCGFASGSPQLATVSNAATTLAVARFNAMRHAGLTTEALGSYRYSVDRDGFPSIVRSMLAQFIRIFPRDQSP